jgi:hypothetical protein
MKNIWHKIICQGIDLQSYLIVSIIKKRFIIIEHFYFSIIDRASFFIYADGPHDGIKIYAIYYKNANTAYLDGIIESKSTYSTGVNYQSGNYVSTVTDPMGNKVTYNYNETKEIL